MKHRGVHSRWRISDGVIDEMCVSELVSLTQHLSNAHIPNATLSQLNYTTPPLLSPSPPITAPATHPAPHKMQLTTRTAFSAAQGAGRSVQCRVVRAEGAARSSSSTSSSDASRRQALSFGLLAGGAALLPANRAWALIPDEEDEEMLERAKANRQKRLVSWMAGG